MPLAWVDENELVPEYLLSNTLFLMLKRNKAIKGYIGRLCNNNKQRITNFFSNPLANLCFLVVYQDEDKVKLSTFLEDFRKILIQQKEMLSFSEQMPLCDIPSLRKSQCEAARVLPFQTAVEAISYKLGQFSKADDVRGK